MILTNECEDAIKSLTDNLYHCRLVSAYQDKLVDSKYAVSKFDYADYITTFGQPSFPSFVQMLLARRKKLCSEVEEGRCLLDRHWRSFISQCGFCDINYTVIAKSESFTEDLKFIGKLANVDFKNIGRLDILIQIFLINTLTVGSHHSSGGSTKELAKKYFSELSLGTVKKLYVYLCPQLYYDYSLQ